MSVRSPGPPAKIAIEELSHVYSSADADGMIHAIDRLSLTVDEGEFMCVLGPSGCGKSTLLYIVAGLVNATAGRVSVGGHLVRGPGPDRGMVFQEYALLPWKTVDQNVALGLRILGVPRSERHRRVAEIIRLVGLEGFERKYPHELSGGMKQRVGVARTLVTMPKVVLMDEPFAALDAQTRMTMQEELIRIWQATRQTVLFVTHSVEEAAYLADRVAILTRRPGRVKEVVEIPVPRSRRRGTTDPGFGRVLDHILEGIRGEVVG